MQYIERYARQIMLPEIGFPGQLALAQASVLIVGAGGLGSPISLYLCTAGIGRIGLIDGDTVSESNLQRQILYTENETGQNKVECAKQTLSSRNESCRIDIYPHYLTEENAREIIEPYDIIVDGCDQLRHTLPYRRLVLPIAKTVCIRQYRRIQGTSIDIQR